MAVGAGGRRLHPQNSGSVYRNEPLQVAALKRDRAAGRQRFRSKSTPLPGSEAACGGGKRSNPGQGPRAGPGGDDSAMMKRQLYMGKQEGEAHRTEVKHQRNRRMLLMQMQEANREERTRSPGTQASNVKRPSRRALDEELDSLEKFMR